MHARAVCRLIVSVLAVAQLARVASALNSRPIVAILTLPCTNPSCLKTQYFPASYPKFLELGGARVVPLYYDMPTASMDTLLDQVNGVLFTGGGADVSDGSPYFEAVKHIMARVMEKNSQGNYFPLWGTCLGFEAIVAAAAQNPNILTDFDAWNYTAPINPTQSAANSKLFSGPGGGEALQLMATASPALPFHNHHSGVAPNDFFANSKLASFFHVVATNVDRAGKEFVTLIEGQTMPVYATQFHPEKNMFEWNTQEGIPHSSEAARAMQYFANFFVQESRRSTQAFATDAEERKWLLYNFQPVFTPDADFIQQYYF